MVYFVFQDSQVYINFGVANMFEIGIFLDFRKTISKIR